MKEVNCKKKKKEENRREEGEWGERKEGGKYIVHDFTNVKFKISKTSLT